MKVKCHDCQVMCINGIPCHESGCHSPTIYIDDNGQELAKWHYLEHDVLGSKREGYEVNDVYSSDIYFITPVDCSDKVIIRELKKHGVVNKHNHFNSFSIDGDDLTLQLEYKGYPFGQLRRE